MSARLRPIAQAEFAAWRAVSAARYAEDMTLNGGYGAEAARIKADRDFDRTLPGGTGTPGHHLYWVVDGDGRDVGSLWLAERESDDGRVAWVYEVRIDEAEQGRGLGRAAMTLAENEARALGLDHVELNVFGGNEVARGLYRSLGYVERAVMMRKTLA